MKTCARCIMNDNGDDTISFDKNGYCNYCTVAIDRMSGYYFPNEEGKIKLDKMIAKIKLDGEGKEYDCMMGISGGLDSSCLAYLGSQWGLRVLCVHLDDGFNTALAEDNIKKLIEKCRFDLVTIKPDPDEFCDLTLSFFKASVSNLAIPQDNVIVAGILKYASLHNIKYFLSGANYALECVLQEGNTHASSDTVHILDIYKKFGGGRINLKTCP